MTKVVSMTDFLRHPSQVRRLVAEGFIIIVKYNNQEIMKITGIDSNSQNSIESIKNDKKNYDILDLPSFDLELPDTISKEDIYNNYGAKSES